MFQRFYITLLLMILLPHYLPTSVPGYSGTEVDYLPVEDSVVLHIIIFFALTLIIYLLMLLRKIYANLLK